MIDITKELSLGDPTFSSIKEPDMLYYGDQIIKIHMDDIAEVFDFGDKKSIAVGDIVRQHKGGSSWVLRNVEIDYVIMERFDPLG